MAQLAAAPEADQAPTRGAAIKSKSARLVALQ